MRSVLIAAIATAGITGAAQADNYKAMDLMSPCQEADNSARWGEAAETECEQYINGFVAALKATGNAGAGSMICPPEQNTPDEVRWAFMRWVHQDFSPRREMHASEALMETMKEAFPCN
ncbi:Rap1a/Tai family immunity protein [Shimia abyssi]|uniref:Rap1a immunity protein domain-containing protein n=1 Tax=Shimia abyssi TaxID=1662395 RepID=A0A2P8FG68_9RHOB|nr:Rap1a/Tai family immunity protein [Shimia abyssi]PSL20714.1 hypothetical protein CLV88_103364 [Shimia abyssi]